MKMFSKYASRQKKIALGTSLLVFFGSLVILGKAESTSSPHFWEIAENSSSEAKSSLFTSPLAQHEIANPFEEPPQGLLEQVHPYLFEKHVADHSHQHPFVKRDPITLANARRNKNALALVKNIAQRLFRDEAEKAAQSTIAETTPALAETTPALAETTPALAETTPVLAETSPAPAETSPALEEKPEVHENETKDLQAVQEPAKNQTEAVVEEIVENSNEIGALQANDATDKEPSPGLYLPPIHSSPVSGINEQTLLEQEAPPPPNFDEVETRSFFVLREEDRPKPVAIGSFSQEAAETGVEKEEESLPGVWIPSRHLKEVAATIGPTPPLTPVKETLSDSAPQLNTEPQMVPEITSEPSKNTQEEILPAPVINEVEAPVEIPSTKSEAEPAAPSKHAQPVEEFPPKAEPPEQSPAPTSIDKEAESLPNVDFVPGLNGPATAPENAAPPPSEKMENPPAVVPQAAPIETSVPVVLPASIEAPATTEVPIPAEAPAPVAIPPSTETTPAPTTPVDASKTPSETPPTAPHKEGYLINFNNVGMVEYLNFISRITSKNFVFDEADLDFKVTIISTEPTPVNNIMAALLQELRIHNLSLMEIGNSIVIHRNPKANSPGTILTDENGKITSDIVTQVFKLSNSEPEKMAGIIRPLLSELALVEYINSTNHLIVTDIATNIEKIRTLISNLDAPTTGFEIGQFVVKYATAETAIVLAEKILAPIAQGKNLTFVPHTATNSIYIISTPYLVNRAIAVLQRLDVPQGSGSTRILSLQNLPLEGDVESLGGPGGHSGAGAAGQLGGVRAPSRAGKWTSELALGHTESTKFYIHKLQYRKGEQIQAALRRIGESLQFSTNGNGPNAPVAQNTDLITTINSIQWIEASNSLVYTGTAESIAKVTELIEEIDISARQVLIEVLILDTTIDDSLSFGVEWGSRFAEPNAAGSQAFLGSTTSVLPAAFDNVAPGIVAPGTPISASTLARTQGFNIGAIGRNVTRGGLSFNSIGAIVSALHQDQRINIVMNPKIIAEDNAPASIFVGQNIPFQTQSIANDFGTILTSTVDYRDIGATLKVTPLIGTNDIITLDIEQEISTLATNVPGLTIGSTNVASIIASSTAANNGLFPVTNKNKTVTKIHVPNGYFVILSGMMQDSDTKTRRQIPCLGGLPIIGAAFSDYNDTDNKRNIMLFLRIQIVERPDIDIVTKRQQDLYKEKNRQQKRWQYEVDGAFDYMNLNDICEPDIRQSYR